MTDDLFLLRPQSDTTVQLCAKFAQCDLEKYQNDVVSHVETSVPFFTP